MLNWTPRDWTSVIVGWVCAIAAAIFLPNEPWKFMAVFVAGFVSAWIIRQLIPR